VFVCIPPGKAIPEMTYTVSGGTLNPTHSLTVDLLSFIFNHAAFCSIFALLYIANQKMILTVDSHTGFPHLLESPGFFLKNSRTWKVLKNHFGPGRSRKLKLKVLESPGKISLKITRCFHRFKWKSFLSAHESADYL